MKFQDPDRSKMKLILGIVFVLMVSALMVVFLFVTSRNQESLEEQSTLLSDSAVGYNNDVHDSVRIQLSSKDSAEQSILALHPSRFYRSNDSTLVVTFRNGQTLTFIDSLLNSDDDRQVKNTLTDYFPLLDVAAIEQGGWEWRNSLLISLNTGHVDTLLSRPILSPNGTMLLSYHLDIDAGFLQNGFQILRSTDSGFAVVYSEDPGSWGPDNAFWIDDSTIAFERVTIEQNNFIASADTLERRLGLWRYTHAVPEAQH